MRFRRSPLLLALLGALAGCAGPAPLPQDAYVWQRSWSPGLRAELRDRGAAFERLAVLAAEVGWEAGEPTLTELHPDPEALAGRPIVAVLRVSAWSGRFEDDQGLPRVAADTVERLQAAGLDIVELQVDFDAASSQLAGYTRWLQAIHAAISVPLTCTALPDWLSRPALPGLLDVVDGWTLQVHDLRPPASPDALIPLTRPEEALEAIAMAASLGRPFQVALPTYAYTAAFTPEGRFLGATAERELPWASGVITAEIGADPVQMAELVARLSADHPPELRGLIWFRFPSAEDAHAWRWSTLSAVMAGQAPRPELRAELHADPDGLVELSLSNEGEADADLPDLALRTPIPPVAADGWGDWRAVSTPDGLLLQARPGARLRAGDARAVAWLRFSNPVPSADLVVDVLD